MGNNKTIALFQNQLSEVTDYEFKAYKDIFINNTPADIDNKCYCSDELWKWPLQGRIYKLDWGKFNFSNPLKELLKGYIFYRLQNKSPYTVVSMDIRFIRYVSKCIELCDIPWSKTMLVYHLGIYKDIFYSLKLFYKWCLIQNIKSFTKEIFEIICDFKSSKKTPYQSTFLRQNYIEDSKINIIISKLNKPLDFTKVFDLQIRILIRLCFEIAPRPSQIYILNSEDLKIFKNESIYYSITLPMVKKISLKKYDKRTRAISSKLGFEISQLISINKELGSISDALFINLKTKKRYSSNKIGSLIIQGLKDIELTSTALRHNLAQSLADQGASAEIIADIMGHNSTIPARAYIAATPKIAEIKTRALGKNNNYIDIMKMFTTGKIVNKSDIEKEKWVKGIAGMQYIGEIGACTLNNVCPKNPVYSCYTCDKFNPFKDGEHNKVLKGLQENIQKFIDTGIRSGDVKYNRTIGQLEETIIAVQKIINYIKNYE